MQKVNGTASQHDYPETIPERFERLQLALIAAERVMIIQEVMNQKID
jgi:hypothetical protein